jgi:ribosomal protein S18 acetylase RimI-like enzyme
MWLSERFGHPVFTVKAGFDDQPGSLREHAAAQVRATYQAKVPAGEVELLRLLTDAGMRVVNVAVALARDPSGAEEIGLPEGVELRDADPARDGELARVAERALVWSRFHLDPDIPGELARRLRRDWVASCLRGTRGDRLHVAARDGRPVGFLAQLDAAGVPVIDLIAVDPSAQRDGLGSALVLRFMAEASRRGARLVRVGTQAANEAGIRFYESLGWRFESAAYDLHMHVGAAA